MLSSDRRTASSNQTDERGENHRCRAGNWSLMLRFAIDQPIQSGQVWGQQGRWTRPQAATSRVVPGRVKGGSAQPPGTTDGT